MYDPSRLTTHPYWQHFTASLQNVVQRLVQSGQMHPTESQIIHNMLANSGPAMQGFVGALMQRYPNGMNTTQMDAEVEASFLPNLRAMARQQMNSMAGGMGGAGMMRPGFGMNPTMYGNPTAPTMFGGGMGVPGSTPAFRPPMNPMGAGLPGGIELPGGGNSTPTTQPQSEFLRPDPELLEKPTQVNNEPWKKPELITTKEAKLAGGTTIAMAKYALSSGSTATRIMAYDNRIRYANDHEVLDAYKPIFKLLGDNDKKKFLTVVYKQLKVLNTGREEFLRLATAISNELYKGGTLEEKLRAIINTLKKFSVGAVKEYTDLFLGEIDELSNCGELVDRDHPKYILDRFGSIDTLLAFITGDIDQNIKNAMFGMKGYKEKLENVVSRVIDQTLAALPKTILTPIHDGKLKDKSVLDDYGRVLPQLWTPDGNIFAGIDDFFDLYISSKERIGDSVTDGAKASASNLISKLTECDKNFTLIYLHRVASWCNYTRTVTVSYEDNGNCKPHVFMTGSGGDDIAFFIEEAYESFARSKLIRAKTSPKTLYCEFEEETVALNYGVTTDGCIWICSSRYWK